MSACKGENTLKHLFVTQILVKMLAGFGQMELRRKILSFQFFFCVLWCAFRQFEKQLIFCYKKFQNNNLLYMRSKSVCFKQSTKFNVLRRMSFVASKQSVSILSAFKINKYTFWTLSWIICITCTYSILFQHFGE